MRRNGVIVLCMLLLSACQQPWLELASRDTAGDGADGDSFTPALSADGRYVAFASNADDLVDGDTNGVTDVFVRDLQTGVVELVSVGLDGAPADGPSHAPSISADGARVSFASEATNLGSDVAGREDVYVRDRLAQTTVSASVSFVLGTRSLVKHGAISGDGTTVWFPGSALFGTTAVQGIVVYDVATGALSFPPITIDFGFFFDGMRHGTVSDDGRYATVALFTLPAPEVTRYVARIDRVAGTVETVTEHDDPFTPASPCWDPVVNGDGGRMAFVCAADSVVPGGSTGTNVYLRDIDADATSIVSVDIAGGSIDGAAVQPALSTEGTFVTFASNATDLVAGDTNATTDVFVRDLDAGATTRISLDMAQATGNHAEPSIGDGELVAFASDSDDLVPGDGAGTTDVVVRAVQVPLIASVTPSTIAPGGAHTLTVTGASFAAGALAEISPGDGVTVDSVAFVSSTELLVTVTVDPSATAGSRRLRIIVPGPGPGIGGRIGSSDHCGCLTVS